MPYSAIKVANEFLRLAREDEPPKQFTPLQMIKLVYIAHGWSLIHLDTPLLREQPQAWQYGPVVPTLYRAIQQYRSGPVSEAIPDNDREELTADALALIKAVYDTYGEYSGIQLSNMTHQPGTPWSEAWNERGRNSTISNEAIRNHYQEISRRNTNTDGERAA